MSDRGTRTVQESGSLLEAREPTHAWIKEFGRDDAYAHGLADDLFDLIEVLEGEQARCESVLATGHDEARKKWDEFQWADHAKVLAGAMQRALKIARDRA